MSGAATRANPTAGPWTYDYSPNHTGVHPSFLVMTRDHTVIAEVSRGPERGVLGGIVEANARLIAEAPELLAVLRGVLMNAGSHIDTEWLERAATAIAKAEGRES